VSVTIESDLKEILAKIDQKLDTLSRDVAEIRQKDLVDLKVGQARLEEKVDGLEKRLEEKIDGLGKRMDNQEFISRGVLIGLLVAILGGFAKLFGLVGNQ
jgi:hypothetical protein